MSELDIFAPFLIVPAWFFTAFGLSRFAWSKIHDKYGCESPTSVQWQGWKSARLGSVNYNNCLWFAFTDKGMYIKTGPGFLFRPFHGPVLIPWSAIKQITTKRVFFMDFSNLSIRGLDIEFLVRPELLRDAKKYLQNIPGFKNGT